MALPVDAVATPFVTSGMPVQRAAASDPTSEDVHAAAGHGIEGGATTLPFLAQVQDSFGPSHDVSRVQAHIGGAAAEASAAMGAQAYATGDHVAFASAPDLHTAAHEAAHVVQQRGGVQLKGGVGEVGDECETHADAVADLVVQGRSAASILDRFAATSSTSALAGQQLQPKMAPGAVVQRGQASSTPGGNANGRPPARNNRPPGRLNFEAVAQGQQDPNVPIGMSPQDFADRRNPDGWLGQIQDDALLAEALQADEYGGADELAFRGKQITSTKDGERDEARETEVDASDDKPELPTLSISEATETHMIETDDFIFIVLGHATKDINLKPATAGKIRFVQTNSVGDCIAVAVQGTRNDGVVVFGIFHLSSHQYSGRLNPSKDLATAEQDEEFENARDRPTATTMFRVQQFCSAAPPTASTGMTSLAPHTELAQIPNLQILPSGMQVADVLVDTQPLGIKALTKKERPGGLSDNRSHIQRAADALAMSENTPEECDQKIAALDDAIRLMRHVGVNKLKSDCIDKRNELKKNKENCSIQ